MTGARKIFAGIFAILFIASGFAALFLSNMERKAFSSETYKQAFKREGLYNDVAGLFAGVVMTYAEDSNSALELITVLGKDELELVISALLPQQELEAVADGFFDSVFTFLNEEADSISIPTTSIKQNLAGEGGIYAITQIMQAYPDCSPAQLLQMGLGILFLDNGTTLCNPPDELMGLVIPLIETQLQLVARSLPDELPIITAGQIESSGDFRPQLMKIRTAMKLSLLLPLVFLLVVTFLAVRKLDDWLRWWGIPILTLGILGTITALAAAPLVPSMTGTLFRQAGPALPDVFLNMVRDVSGTLTREILRPVAIQGIALMLAGAVMVVVSAIINRNE